MQVLQDFKGLSTKQMTKLSQIELIKHIPLVHKLYNAGASFTFIVDKILKTDKNLASDNRENVYKVMNLIYNKFKNNTLHDKYSNLVALVIPNELIDAYVNKYFFKVSGFYIALKSTVRYYDKYILTRDQFMSSVSETFIDKLYCKRIMKWFDIDDAILISQAENTVQDLEFSKKLYHDEMAEIDKHYIKYYNTMHTLLLNKLSNLTE